MTSTPLVTICIPSYNHGTFLAGAVESVLGQTYRNVECLVFDDGSTDGSWEIAQAYAGRDPRVRVLSHEGRHNHGIGMTLNAAYSQARGKYIAHLAADDFLTARSVERRVLALADGVDFVHGRAQMLDADGTPIAQFGGRSAEAMCRADRTDDPLEALLLHNYISSTTVLARREVIASAGGFNEDVYYLDWELWIVLLARGARFVFLDGDPLARCRPGAHGPDADLPRRLEVFRALVDKAKRGVKRLSEPRVLALVHLQEGLHAALSGLEREAGEAISSAFEADPSLSRDPAFLFWWLGPVQRRRLPGGALDATSPLLEVLAEHGDADRAVAVGARQGHFGCWAIQAARTHLAEDVLRRIRWAVIGNELELEGPRVRPGLLSSLLVQAARHPNTLRDRAFVKVLLSSAGLWSAAVRLRRLLARSAR